MRRDPVTREVVDLIADMSARFHEEYEAAAAAHDLTAVQAKLLTVVADEPVPMNRIAAVLKCEPSNITGLVDRLAARGLVTREPSANDRRVKLVAATSAGTRLSGEVWANLDFAAEPLAALSDQERRTLRDLLRRIQQDAATPDGRDVPV
ncbi:MarR family transcriptional regulator [Actinocrinis puniceicyclus]|uniref:MarR family transcriptional regulator n=1 Tax=Actinocrinis puniceicyclus TaxID=977794 RepID=A0A8J7WTB3_9ACTN|nr:MarR family transcriptional regulator [Actinocrinis puniceicyclus]MBS2965295.1 MarR family transcriptional regulator [Actinocrinis puniceicyclus]